MLRRVGQGVLEAAGRVVPSYVEQGLAGCDPAWVADGVGAYCPRCGASIGPNTAVGAGCPFCFGERFPWQRLTRLGMYQAPLSGWIKQMKHEVYWAWAPWLGRQLAARVPEPLGGKGVLVAPVPLHWRRRWKRGFNQAQLMAEALAAARGWGYGDLLRRCRWTPPQTAIAPSARVGNVRSAFEAAPVDLGPYHVVLVDDVKTSGATLTACARRLRERGCMSVSVAVVAVADPRGRGFEVVEPRG